MTDGPENSGPWRQDSKDSANMRARHEVEFEGDTAGRHRSHLARIQKRRNRLRIARLEREQDHRDHIEDQGYTDAGEWWLRLVAGWWTLFPKRAGGQFHRFRTLDEADAFIYGLSETAGHPDGIMEG